MREILVFGDKTFKIVIPDDAKLTFGPWSPPKENGRFDERESKRGTLRVYGKNKEDILACFAGVTGFRDASLEYMEEVAREEVATLWRSDEKGYVREEKAKAERVWTKPELAAASSNDSDNAPF